MSLSFKKTCNVTIVSAALALSQHFAGEEVYQGSCFVKEAGALNMKLQMQSSAPVSPVSTPTTRHPRTLQDLDPKEYAEIQDLLGNSKVCYAEIQGLLPDGKEAKTSEGETYYYNVISNKTQWNPPLWTEYTTPNGRKYYHNRDTNEAQWTKPIDSRLQQQSTTPTTSPPTTPTTSPPTTRTRPTTIAANPSIMLQILDLLQDYDDVNDQIAANNKIDELMLQIPQLKKNKNCSTPQINL